MGLISTLVGFFVRRSVDPSCGLIRKASVQNHKRTQACNKKKKKKKKKQQNSSSWTYFLLLFSGFRSDQKRLNVHTLCDVTAEMIMRGAMSAAVWWPQWIKYQGPRSQRFGADKGLPVIHALDGRSLARQVARQIHTHIYLYIYTDTHMHIHERAITTQLITTDTWISNHYFTCNKNCIQVRKES